MISRLFNPALNTNGNPVMQAVALFMAPLLMAFVLILANAQIAHAAAVPQSDSPHDNHSTMGQGMMDVGMMGASNAISGTMSMAEMGAMMDTMSAMMATMPVSGTMPMGQMGQMMQMMGMMHQHMGMMQMKMGSMMAGGMMDGDMMAGGMMGMGMMGDMPCMGNVPSAAATMTPEAGADSEDATNEDATSEDTSASAAVDEVEATADVHPPLVANPIRQSAAAGAVTVEVMPLPPTDPLEVAFEVTLETHSVELDFDLAKLATLTIGDAGYSASAWEPDADSGHHVAGILRFTIDESAHAELSVVDVAVLDLTGINGQDLTFVYTVAAK